ncbi:MAG: MBL fold metallo-hydrolase [Actinobacteria bacterium]|nr:MBL fold metallo-hydrolase [Actinomycetota bacterium]
MSQHRKATSALTVIVVAGVIAGAYFMGRSDERAGRSFSLAGSAQAAETPAMSPVKRSTKLDMYFPGTEDLAANEMRIVACGTGMPAQRKSQAATCWLVELGNGDKFLFDIGTGSSANLGSLNIPYDYLNKVFLSHLHSDHIGDMDALWIGGWTGGRQGGRTATSRRPARSTRWIT